MSKTRDNKKSTKILIAEADDKSTKYLNKAVKQLGYYVAGNSSSGSETVKSALRLKPSIIIISSDLKGTINAAEAAKRILKKNSASFIFLLNDFDSQKINSIKKTFQAEFLVKPFNTSDLKTALEFTLHKQDTVNKLNDYEIQLHNIYSNAPGLIITFNRKGIVTSASKLLLNLVGVKPKKIIGQKLIDLVSDNSKKSLSKKILPEIFKTGNINDAKISLRKSNNEFLDVSLNVSREIDFIDKEETFVCILTDISKINHLNNLVQFGEEKYKALIERMQDGVFIINNGVLEYANNIVADTLGYKLHELKGKKLSELVAPEDYNLVSERYNKRINGIKVPDTYEVKLLHKSGILVTVNLTVGVIIMEGEKLVLGTIKDITETKQTYKALAESQQRFKTFYENTFIGIYRCSPDGKIIMANPALIAMLGYSAFNDLASNNRIDISYTPFYEREWFGNVIKKEGQIIGHETQWMRSDNTTIWVRESAKAAYDSNGKIIYYDGTVENITDKKNFEQRLKNLSRAVEQSPSSIVITDTKGNIEYVNPKFCEVTGYSFDELIGQNPRIIKSDYKSSADYQKMWEVIGAGNEWHGEFLNKKKSGELFWEQASISPITNDDGVITNFLAIKEDVTQRKLFEEELIRAKESAEKADKLKSEFLAQMSHEIRTPLNNILTYIGLVREEFEQKLPPGMESSFVIIDNSSKRLIRTIELILNLSEIQTGNFRVKNELINLDKDILENISLEFFNRARAKNLELVYEKKTTNGKILGDSYSIAQIFNNLLENAIKYTNHGRVDILLFERGEKVCVEVKDTGIGISPKYLPNLFSPFTQEEMGYTRRFEGNGLGLSLVKKYVDINGAEIFVESEKHKGSTFRVMFNKKH